MGGSLWIHALGTSCVAAVPPHRMGLQDLLSEPHLVLSKSSLPRGVTEHGNSQGIPGRQPGGGGGRDPQPPLRGIQRRASPVPGWGPRNPPSLPPRGPQVVAHLGSVITAMQKPSDTQRSTSPSPPKTALQRLQCPLEPFWGDSGPPSAFVGGRLVIKHCCVQKEG